MMKAYYPETLEEALEALKNKDSRIIAGGTDLKLGRTQEGSLIFTEGIHELKKITRRDTHLAIGAGVTLSMLLEEREIPFMEKLVRSIASPGIRNWASVGGNLCNASPIGDLLPMVYALDGRVKLIKKGCERLLPIEEFILGRKRTALEEEELLKEVVIYCPVEGYKYFWIKISGREANSLSKVNSFATYKYEEKKLVDLKIAMGGLGPTVIREREIEEELIEVINRGEGVEELEVLFKEYQKLFRPVTDQRSESSYKLGVSRKIYLNLMEYILKDK
ncbi:xanthine dehydrogenase FAD-binding subunit XdhB [Propionigenium maris DSM 9537]|uniref:Xanthine dehydrogenase FAD-binding subunit XdhB n=1 Tax=Propionigenium maris DSM 9537 TaxID=1123000 RepID=A0A9W6GML1_9FUSO|nr:FAD binding domain-containing protein [Propionigenium maris]GLI57067.1 xanthine dehydrogenase FAD-binding subunit XdhB [Propionigenium maris DSM 9537]